VGKSGRTNEEGIK
jgi:dimethylargininase